MKLENILRIENHALHVQCLGDTEDMRSSKAHGQLGKTFGSSNMNSSEEDIPCSQTKFMKMEDLEIIAKESTYLPQYSDISDFETDFLKTDNSFDSSSEDEILYSASQKFEAEYISDRFAEPKSDAVVDDMKQKFVPDKTRKNIEWACRLFEDWRCSRNSKILGGDTSGKRLSLITNKLLDLNDDELNYCLCRFILEVRKQDGTDYPPKTLRQLVLLIQMYLNNNNRDVQFLSDTVYTEVRITLDNLMRDRASKGMGLRSRQASVITVQQEQILWEKGILGSACPQTLLDTMVYLVGLNFALRSGSEHRMLRVDQFEWGSNNQGDYLRYTECISKCNQRGLNDVGVAPKSVTAYSSSDPNKCLVRLYRRYLSLRPSDAPDAFYLRPLGKPRHETWYSCSPIGQNTLTKTVSRLCAAAGFTGFYTNHSLRATCATRLYQSGVDEQLIAKRTGHRSNAIRSYKRTSDEQEDDVSKIVQGFRKRSSTTSATSPSTGTTKCAEMDAGRSRPVKLEFSFNFK